MKKSLYILAVLLIGLSVYLAIPKTTSNLVPWLVKYPTEKIKPVDNPKVIKASLVCNSWSKVWDKLCGKDKTFEQIKEKDDGLLTDKRNDEIRITFERELTNSNDVTITARGEGSLTVFTSKGIKVGVLAFKGLETKKLSTFAIGSTTEDTFIIQTDGNLEIDYITDPQFVCNGTATACGSLNTTQCPNQIGCNVSSGTCNNASQACSSLPAANCPLAESNGLGCTTGYTCTGNPGIPCAAYQTLQWCVQNGNPVLPCSALNSSQCSQAIGANYCQAWTPTSCSGTFNCHGLDNNPTYCPQVQSVGICTWDATPYCRGTATACSGLGQTQCGTGPSNPQYGCTWTDNCAYPGSGNWLLDCSLNCALGTTDMHAYTLTLTGPGATNLNGNLSVHSLVIPKTCSLGIPKGKSLLFYK